MSPANRASPWTRPASTSPLPNKRSAAATVQKVAPDVSVYGVAHRLAVKASSARKAQHRIYENLAEIDTVVAAILPTACVQEAHAGAEVEIVLPETPTSKRRPVSDTGEIHISRRHGHARVERRGDDTPPHSRPDRPHRQSDRRHRLRRRPCRRHHRHRAALGHHAQPHGHAYPTPLREGWRPCAPGRFARRQAVCASTSPTRSRSAKGTRRYRATFQCHRPGELRRQDVDFVCARWKKALWLCL